jgi:hypothetical protein
MDLITTRADAALSLVHGPANRHQHPASSIDHLVLVYRPPLKRAGIPRAKCSAVERAHFVEGWLTLGPFSAALLNEHPFSAARPFFAHVRPFFP